MTTYPVNGPLAPNTSRVVSVADSHTVPGAVLAPNVVPVGATAAEVNVTVSSPTNKNFLRRSRPVTHCRHPRRS